MAEIKSLHSLQTEQEAFNAQLDELMKEHAGQFVLFHQKAPVGYFETFDQAYRAGLERFGVGGVFLVSEIVKRGPETPSVSWLTGAMFGET